MESFGEIIDPETNRSVPVESAVGKQVIKNYLECLKNGPESKNILSTKMFYKNRAPAETPVAKNVTPSSRKEESSTSGGLTVYEKAKKLTSKQFEYDYLTQRDFYQKGSGERPSVNDVLWIKRSNGKWQLANVAKVGERGLEVYFNNGEGKIGVKKGLGSRDVLDVSAKVKKLFC